MNDTLFDSIPPCIDTFHPYIDIWFYPRIFCNKVDGVLLDTNFGKKYSFEHAFFEHYWNTQISKQLGLVYHSEYDASYTWGLTSKSLRMVYYKKNISRKTWGTPYTFTSNISEKHKEFSFQTYPNPVSSILFIKGDDFGHSSYSLLNSLGQEIQSGELINNQIDCSNLTNGIYFLRLIDQDDNSGIQRLVISK